MGQYYIPYLKDLKSGAEQCLNSHHFDSGLKLTEHSWIGNHFCNAVLNLIKDNPKVVAWIGDYAEFEDLGSHFVIGEAEFTRIYNNLWQDEKWEKQHQVEPSDDNIKFDFNKRWFLVNKTKKQVIDLSYYIKQSTIEDDWCLQPLSLLTAVGNGKGGGDYRGCNLEYIGYWAFDEIYISEQQPEGYLILEDVIFKENW